MVDRQHRIGVWTATLCALCAATIASTCDAVSLSPEAEARLAKMGRARLVTESAFQQSLHERGVDVPDPRTALRMERYPNAVTVHGSALVILVDFPDKPATTAPAHYDSLLFQRDLPGGSLRDYYLEVSRGRYDVSDGRVIGWLRMPETYAYYVDGQRGFGTYPRNAQKLAEGALAAAAEQVDMRAFDNDGPDGVSALDGSTDDDGLVDGIFIVHAGSGFEITLDVNDIHSHEWGVHYPVVYDATTAWLYSMEPEDGSVGVFCHEYGHVLGLPDLYDIGGNIGASGIGRWSLMATGSWNSRVAPGDTPAHLDAWCKAQLGFLDPLVVHGTLTSQRVLPVEDGGTSYRLSTHALPGPEYFLLENRQAIGFDAALPGAGLLVYHVDERVPLQTDPNHYKVAIVQADNLRQLEGSNFSTSGDSGDPFPGVFGRTTFGPDTDPPSVLYDGTRTDVGFTIHVQDRWTFVADIFTSLHPFIQLAEADPAWAFSSDGGVVPTALSLRFANLGTSAKHAHVSVRSLTEGIGAADPSGLDVVFAGQSADARMALVDLVDVQVQDHRDATFEVTSSTDDGVTRADTVHVSFGRSRGLDAATPPAGWTHSSLRAGDTDPDADAWRVATDTDGGPSWTTGREDGTTKGFLDAALVTPAFVAGPGATLTFRHRMDADVFTHRVGWDGGVVDASVDGGSWVRLAPTGGYPYVLDVWGQTALSGALAYSGHDDAYEDASFALDQVLDDRVRTIQLRFRFATGKSTVGSGWWVRDVHVSAGRAPALTLGAVAAGGTVRLLWDASDPSLAAPLAVWRAHATAADATPTRFERIADLTAAEAAEGSYVDRTAPEGTALRYQLTLGDSLVAQAAIDAPAHALRVDLSSSPARGPIGVRFALPQDGPLHARVFDVRGRLVQTIYDGPAPAGETRVRWEPSIGAGVYTIVAESGGLRAEQRVVLLAPGAR